jgi:hypothetical protein
MVISVNSRTTRINEAPIVFQKPHWAAVAEDKGLHITGMEWSERKSHILPKGFNRDGRHGYPPANEILPVIRLRVFRV